MQLIFKYDIDRLLSYSNNPHNNIHIADEDSFMMLSFPEVDYFNYAFTLTDHVLEKHQIEDIKEFYLDRHINKHKIIVNSKCQESNVFLSSNAAYKQVSTIVKTGITPEHNCNADLHHDLSFIKADDSNIDQFTHLYLKGFDSDKKTDNRIVNNFRSLLQLKNLDLFLIRNEEKYVGINVLYQSATESLLAGGAILPEHRNKGYHQQSLKFRINKALSNQNSRNIIAWAYSPSVSLKNMLKLKMKPLETFNVYEYSK